MVILSEVLRTRPQADMTKTSLEKAPGQLEIVPYSEAGGRTCWRGSRRRQLPWT